MPTALSFPTSPAPTVGQVYNNYSYDGVKWNPIGVAFSTVSTQIVNNGYTLTVGIDGTVGIPRDLVFTGSSSGSVTFAAGATPAVQTYTLPAAYPSVDGYALTSTSGGTLSWTVTATGSVTGVSVVSANGFTGTVANSTTTPAITLTTSITGLLKGDGTAISAAVAGTDYQAPIGTITGLVKGNGANALTAATAGTDYQAPVSATGILKSNGTGGTVTAATAGTDYLAPSGLSVTTAAASSGGSLSYSNGVFTFAPASLSGYLTSITSSDVTTALGFTPYNATNPSGYITTNGIPSQTDNGGKVLTTDGSTLSWSSLKTINGTSIAGTGDITAGISTGKAIAMSIVFG